MCINVYIMCLSDKISTNNVKYEFKMLYAIGITLIVIGHCKDSGISFFSDFFPYYSFHLALFVFASGYFYNQKYEQSVKDFLIKKIKRLIIPLYIWNIFYAILLHIIKHFGFFGGVHITLKSIFWLPITNGHQFILNLGGWFVIPLFMIHVINILIRKLLFKLNIKINEFLYFIFCLLLGCLGVFLSNSGYKEGFYLVLERFLYFLPFYSLGFLYKKYEKYDKMNNLAYFGIIFFITLLIIYYWGGMPTCIPSWADFHGYFPLVPFISGIIGIAFWFRISKILSPIAAKSKYINIIADNTYTIMINHLLGFKVLDTCFAILHKYTTLCANFDIHLYKTTVWGYYLIHNKSQFIILYIIFGIVFSIALKNFILKIIDFIKNCTSKFSR